MTAEHQGRLRERIVTSRFIPFEPPKNEYSTVSGDFYFHAHVDTAAFVLTLGVTMRDWQGHRLLPNNFS